VWSVFGETFTSPSINTYLDSFTFAVESVQGGGSLLALVLAPERVNAWVNLGQAYAKQGQRSVAVACLANGYRFSENQAATRQFLHKLAEDGDEDEEVRKAARQTLQLPVVQAGKD
jgi:hypothetical protein